MGLSGDSQDLDGLRTDQHTVQMLHAEIAGLLLQSELFVKGTHGERNAVDNGIVREITEGDGLAVRGHEFGDMNRLAEDSIAVLISEILTVLILERFQLQGRLIVHEPCAAGAVLLVHGEVQSQHIVKADIAGYRYADFGIGQNAVGLIPAGAVDEGVLLGLTETLGELDHEVLLQIETEIADEIRFQSGDDRQLVCDHILLRKMAVSSGGDGPVLWHPFGLKFIVGNPDGGVILGGVHNGADPAEKVVFLQGRRILAGRALREQIRVGKIMFRTGEIVVGGIIATHGFPEGLAVMGSTGQKQLVVHFVIHFRVLLTDSSGTDTWPHLWVNCSSVPSACRSRDRRSPQSPFCRADGRCEA